jgi:hypothetical protein
VSVVPKDLAKTGRRDEVRGGGTSAHGVVEVGVVDQTLGVNAQVILGLALEENKLLDAGLGRVGDELAIVALGRRGSALDREVGAERVRKVIEEERVARGEEDAPEIPGVVLEKLKNGDRTDTIFLLEVLGPPGNNVQLGFAAKKRLRDKAGLVADKFGAGAAHQLVLDNVLEGLDGWVVTLEKGGKVQFFHGVVLAEVGHGVEHGGMGGWSGLARVSGVLKAGFERVCFDFPGFSVFFQGFPGLIQGFPGIFRDFPRFSGYFPGFSTFFRI